MTRRLAGTAIVLMIISGCASAAEPPLGEWVQNDIRGMESIAGATCTRMWIEERKYTLNGDAGQLMGSYGNVIRAMPIGMPSLPACKYPKPASSPIATQMRLWSLIGRPNDDGTWRIGAQPEQSGGDFDTFKMDEFKTRLTLRGATLIDAASDPDDPDALVFRRPAAPEPEARAALEEAVRRLQTGACVPVMMELGATQQVAAQMCALRKRITNLGGAYVSLSVDAATEFHRVPDNFPRPSTGMRRQRGVVYSFTTHYERQAVPGNAVVYEENGKWRVALLWV